jgi:hypothetical protein
MKKYSYNEYLEYVKQLEKDVPGALPISFEDWKWVQPIADKAAGLTDGIIKSHISNKKEDL